MLAISSGSYAVIDRSIPHTENECIAIFSSLELAEDLAGKINQGASVVIYAPHKNVTSAAGDLTTIKGANLHYEFFK